MGRIIAIDYGTKRVGVAVNDPMRIIASPLDTVHSTELVGFLQKYMETEEVDVLVIGLPKRLDNTDSHITQLIRELTVHLTRKFPSLKVENVDERFTSKIAFNAAIAPMLAPIIPIFSLFNRMPNSVCKNGMSSSVKKSR